MKDKVFFDSNIVLYALRKDNIEKSQRSIALLSDGGVISVQVLTETTNVLRKKGQYTWSEINDFLNLIRSTCKVVNLTVRTFALAQKIAEAHQFSIYDSMIIATANEADCHHLYSEDMQHNFKFKKLKIINPFK